MQARNPARKLGQIFSQTWQRSSILRGVPQSSAEPQGPVGQRRVPDVARQNPGVSGSVGAAMHREAAPHMQPLTGSWALSQLQLTSHVSRMHAEVRRKSCPEKTASRHRVAEAGDCDTPGSGFETVACGLCCAPGAVDRVGSLDRLEMAEKVRDSERFQVLSESTATCIRGLAERSVASLTRRFVVRLGRVRWSPHPIFSARGAGLRSLLPSDAGTELVVGGARAPQRVEQDLAVEYPGRPYSNGRHTLCNALLQGGSP
jgi:hypothetical protein